MPARITPEIRHTLQMAADRGLSEPLLLFIASHRPLAFVAAQLLTLAAPTAALAGYSGLQDWAELLNDPASLDRLERALEVASTSTISDDLEANRIDGRLSAPDDRSPDTLGDERRKNCTS